MNAAELVQFMTYGVFGLIFVGVVRTAARERNRASIDAVLLFGAFALVIAQSQVAALLDVTLPRALALLGGVALLATPYFLLRLVDDFADAPRWLMRLCLATFAFIVAGLFVFVSPPQIWFFLIAGAYFVGFVGYAGLTFALVSRQTRGVARRRMVAAACGSLGLGLVVLIAVGARTLPAIAAITGGLALASAVAYLVAFAPPGLLRRAWREPLLRSFLATATAVSPTADQVAIIRELEAAARAAAAAPGAAIAVWQESSDTLLDAAGDPVSPAEGLARTVFETQRAAARGRAAAEWPLAGRGEHKRALLAAPISVRGRRLGVLVLSARRARLFTSDDLDLVQLLADQAALVLDGARLYGDLAAANHELSEATRVKSEFLANMSHELRTPLNAILGFSGLLSEQIGPSLTDRQQRFIRNIKEAGEHLLELINDVLDLSKVEAGKVELRPEVVSLDALLEPVVAVLGTSAAAKGLTVEVDARGTSSVFIDPVRVRQVLLNLVSNAVKFTDAGGIRFVALQDGADLQFELTDTGIGIPLEAHSRVFGVFERLHEGTSKAPGTGLGLALTKRLVELMGGTISFESSPGLGTTFRVRIADALVQQISGAHLLIVEDERHDAELVVAVAATLDLRSEVVRTLAGAREALARSTPLGVVLDLRLPDGRGEVLLRELSERTAKVPVVVVSVEGEPAASLALGADDYLSKPIDRGRLLRWLGRVTRAGTEPTPRVEEATRAHLAH